MSFTLQKILCKKINKIYKPNMLAIFYLEPKLNYYFKNKDI